MHRFTREQLEKFSQWDSLAEGYSRNDLEIERKLLATVITPLLEDLRRAVGFVKVTEDCGLTPYYSIWCQPQAPPENIDKDEWHTFDGIHLYLSFCYPACVIGRTRCGYHNGFISAGLEPEEVLHPDSIDFGLALIVKNCVLKTPYQILTPEEIMQPLPEGIEPYEYCLNKEPWDKVFHVMFSHTD